MIPIPKGCFAALGFLAVCSAMAQSPQISVGAASVDSVLQTTVVPAHVAPVRLVEREGSEQEMTRAQRRELKAERYAQHIDSLVQSRNYTFLPNSMQQYPKGMLRMTVANFFYFGFFTDHVEVHLPTERGPTQYVYSLNFDSTNIRDYQASHQSWGWNVTFGFTGEDGDYQADIAVSTTTGETILTLATPLVTMRYVGWLWDKREHEK